MLTPSWVARSKRRMPTLAASPTSNRIMNGGWRSGPVRRAAAVAMALCSVSAFAQSHSGRDWDLWTASVSDTRGQTIKAYGIMRAYGADRGPIVVTELPANLTLPSAFRALLEAMLRSSPTFRRQCLRLGLAPELRVTVRPSPASSARVRATTRFVTTPEGPTAIVELLSLDDPVELIAHEIEHVIERLDGVDLRHRAGLPRTGVRMCEDGAYETTRAVRTGLLVSREVRGQVE